MILAVDPAVSKKRSAEASALVTLGKTSNHRVHCLEALARRVAAPELVELIDDADRRWNPDLILFESNAAFKGIKDLMTKHARFGSKVMEIVHSREKHARRHSFSVRVENGAFLFRGAGGTVDHCCEHLALAQASAFERVVSFDTGSSHARRLGHGTSGT